MAGIEVGLIYALRSGQAKGVTWPKILMAALAALFLALGVLRHYWDVYVHRTVRGISFIFCGIDALGDLTSLVAVLFQPQLDILGMVIYGVELVLWLGIFACGGYYNLRPWLRQKTFQRAAGQADSTEPSHNMIEETDIGAADVVALHELPSSTSVFRTSSAGLDTTRPRAGRSSLQSIHNRMS